MNLFSKYKKFIENIVKDILKEEGCEADWFQGVTLEPPREAAHGDMASNIAMVLCRKAKMKPRNLAEKILPLIEALEGVEKVEIAGPGFINITLDSLVWQSEIQEVLEQGVRYGDSAMGAEAGAVNVEYVSANPTGPMHIGHARGAVVGDALAALLKKAGYSVVKEYYINDAGGQIDVLAQSVFLRYLEACGEDIIIPEGLYPGDYLKPIGNVLKQKFDDSLLSYRDSYADEALNADLMEKIKPVVIEGMMDLIRRDLKDLGVEHQVFASEKTLHEQDKVQESLEFMKSKGLIYRGILEPPKGKLPDDWEAREQTLFRSTDFGDDVDRALQKSNGNWTYFAADMAYARDKISRDFKHLVMVLGADHGGYVKRMKAAVKALSDGEVSLDIHLCQLVKFMENGRPIKMSKRAGTFTTVRDVIEAVGKDVVRFIMLTRKPEQPLDFDLEKVCEQSRENPVFYVQYAHARCHSLLRMGGEQLPEALEKSCEPTAEQLALLSSEPELALIRLLANWPRMVEAAAKAYEPHRIAYYLGEVAAAFHGFWNAGKDDTSLRIIHEEDVQLTTARLAMVRAVQTVIASGLEVCGVTPLDEMR